jgi:hypothetical protein
MGCIQLRFFHMTGSASLTTYRKITIFFVGSRSFINVAVKTFQPIMRGMGQVNRNRGIVLTGFVAVDTYITRDGIILLARLLGN